MKFKDSHILTVDQFERKDFEKIIKTSAFMEKALKENDRETLTLLEGNVIATLFYEPSTRTKLSFQSAISRLSGRVISETSIQFSSMYKGETSYDTAQMVSNYADAIIMRHPDDHSVEQFSHGSKVPVINAGDGSHEHPTQALLDLYTIFKEKQSLDNITISFIGDLKYGRTVHSLIKVLLNFENVTFKFISPKSISLPQYILDRVEEHGNVYIETEDLQKGLEKTDVVYMTRIQKERFESQEEYLKYHGVYIIDQSVLKDIDENAIIMHPLPRIGEITQEVDKDPRAKYFDQAANGVFVRMALLTLCLGKIKS